MTANILPISQNIFFSLKVVMLHIKLMGMEYRAPCKHIFCTHTLDPWDGVKRSKHFNERSHAAYQIIGNGA